MRISENQLRKMISRLISEQVEAPLSQPASQPQPGGMSHDRPQYNRGGPVNWYLCPDVISTFGSQKRLGTMPAIFKYGGPEQFIFPGGEGKKFANLMRSSDPESAAQTFANEVKYFNKLTRKSVRGKEKLVLLCHYKLDEVYPPDTDGFTEARVRYVECDDNGVEIPNFGNVQIMFQFG